MLTCVVCVWMELIHIFVKRLVYCSSGKYTFLESRIIRLIILGSIGWLSIMSLINRGLTKVGIRAILTVVTQAWSSLGYFENLNFKVSNEFESLSNSRILLLIYLSFLSHLTLIWVLKVVFLSSLLQDSSYRLIGFWDHWVWQIEEWVARYKVLKLLESVIRQRKLGCKIWTAILQFPDSRLKGSWIG